MKFGRLAILFLVVLLIAACSDKKENIEVDGGKEKIEDTSIKKHESVELPVTIFVDENKYPGKDATFTRSIESVEISDFTEETVIEFKERYSQIGQLNLDLMNEYKRVLISMSHLTEGDVHNDPFEAFILDEQSEVHFNGELIIDEVVSTQIRHSSLDYKMGVTNDENGDVILAIPKGYFEGNLQLKTIIRNNDNTEVVYIDLQ